MMRDGYILVIDDDVEIQIALTEFLKDDGYHVQSVSNGAEALDLLRSGGPLPRLILLDLMMPVCDGFQFRAEQRKDPMLAEIPTILISADGNLKQKAESIGIDGFLQKPIGLANLFSAVGRYF